MKRAEKRWVKYAKKLKELREKGVPHEGEFSKADAVVPRTMAEVRALLSGRDSRFREPITRRERRAYDRVWANSTGEGHKGYTKPVYNKHEKARKLRQDSHSPKL